MEKLTSLIRSFAADETGATAIEYGLIAILVAIPCIAAFGVLGGKVNSSFTAVADGFK